MGIISVSAAKVEPSFRSPRNRKVTGKASAATRLWYFQENILRSSSATKLSRNGCVVHHSSTVKPKRFASRSLQTLCASSNQRYTPSGLCSRTGRNCSAKSCITASCLLSITLSSYGAEHGRMTVLHLSLRPRFEHEVERCLGGSPEAAESAGGDDLAHASLSDLGTQSQAYLLILRR